MRARLCLFLALLLLAARAPGAAARDATTITDITIDGDIHENAPSYTRDAASNDVYCYWNTQYRGFVEWDTSTIPDAAVVDIVQVRFRSYSANYDGAMRMYEMASQPSAQADNDAGNQVIYDDAANGDIYVTTPAGVVDTWYTVTLSAAAAADLEAGLASDWFAVGTYIPAGGADSFYSSETAYDAELIVQWHLAADYAFHFDDAVYENGTDAGAVTVHASGENITEEFTVDGDDWWYGPALPELFYWDLGGGYGRVMYVAGEENFTVTLPESAFTTYGFTVKDYTGKLGTGAAYLEAYRTVAAETLIERGRIYAGNPVPLNLVVGRTYHLKVLWADGTRYDWGYYVALGDTSTDLIIRGVDFGEQAYTVNRFITVQAARPAPTNITVDYTDSRAGTVWLNVTIRVRNGAVVVEQSFATDTIAYTWAGAGASTDYAVTVEGRHLDQGEWGYGKILDAEQTFLPAPDLGTVFTLGSLDMSGLLAYTLTLTTLLSFSYAFRERGLLAAMAVANIMSYLGWADWGYNLLALGWFFSVVVNLTAGGRG